MAVTGPIVLLVEDEVEMRRALRPSLRAHGYQVVEAGTGREALAQAAGRHPVVILLDLVMPNMDGWQFIEARSRDARLARIPVVLISGQLAAEETARSLGLASYIEKPIAVASLREMLSKMRDRSPSART